MTSRGLRIGKYTIVEVPSLKKHKDPSSTLVILVLSHKNNSKCSKLVLIEYKHLLTHWWAVGGHTCGPTFGYIYWSCLMVYVSKGNLSIDHCSICNLIMFLSVLFLIIS